jgi:hypothetical protein
MPRTLRQWRPNTPADPTQLWEEDMSDERHSDMDALQRLLDEAKRTVKNLEHSRDAIEQELEVARAVLHRVQLEVDDAQRKTR